MIIIDFDESEVYGMHGETPEEDEFLASCPNDWTWNKVYYAYLNWKDKQDAEIH